jgi:hypothetical protein
MAAFPEYKWLSNALVDAQRAYRDRTWEALSPSQLDQLANSRHSRLIRTDEDLCAATLVALQAIEQRLQGDTPSANLLWDTHSGRPKSEEEISDYLSIELGRQLHERGAVVNREVQVRRTKPTGLSERTDLRMEALPKQEDEATGPLKIPGEVKGAWNAGVIDEVESQLVNRYMADIHTNHGVYGAIWFDLESWTNEDDSRKSRAASHGSREQLRSPSRNKQQDSSKMAKGLASSSSTFRWAPAAYRVGRAVLTGIRQTLGAAMSTYAVRWTGRQTPSGKYPLLGYCAKCRQNAA